MTTDGQALEHTAFPYGSGEEFLATMVPFLRDGLAQGHAAAAVTSLPNIALLQGGLGSDAGRVLCLDHAGWYERPAGAIAEYDAVIWQLLSGGAPVVRLISELPFHGTRDEHVTWTRYEAILNQAFERSPLWAVCPYDTRALPNRVVQDAYRTHPTVWKAGRRAPSPRFVDPATLLRELPESIRIPVGEPHLRLPITGANPDRWRHRVAAMIADSGLPPIASTSSSSPSPRWPPTPSGTEATRHDSPCGLPRTQSSARSTTTALAWTTPSPATSHPPERTTPAWTTASGSPGSSATPWPSKPARGEPPFG